MKSVVNKLFHKPDKKIIYPLYTLRFIFFIFIFVHHMYNYIQIEFLKQYSLAVSGFIILSGFLTGYQRIESKDVKDTNIIRFSLNRIKKIYPLHIIILLILVAISGIFNSMDNNDLFVNIKKILCHIFLFQSWINDRTYYFSLNGSAWFLSTYFFLCFITIPVIKILRIINNRLKHKNIILILLAIILFLLSLAVVYIVRVNGLNEEFYLYIFPPSRIMEYVIGIIFGILYKNNKIDFKNDKILFSVFEIFTILLLVYVIMNQYNNSILLSGRLNIWIIPLVLLITILAYQKGIISYIFRYKILVYLGKITMYLYIIHLPIISILTKAAGYQIHYRYFALYVFLLTIIIGSIINKFYELKAK